MLACYIVINAKKGVSSVQLAKFINVTQKTAWFMLQRIQNCFNIDASQCLNGGVEVDETYIGGLNKNRHSSKKVRNARGRSCKDKVPVFGMLQREGFVIAKVVNDTKAGTLIPIINDVVCPGSTIFSDECRRLQEESGSFNDEMLEFIDIIFGHKDMISKENTIHINIKHHEVGEIFNYRAGMSEMTLKVVKANDECSGCVFKNSLYNCTRSNCMEYEREDGESIKYIIVNTNEWRKYNTQDNG